MDYNKIITKHKIFQIAFTIWENIHNTHNILLSKTKQATNFCIQYDQPFEEKEVLRWPKSSFSFKVRIKDMLFFFTKNFAEQCIHCFVPRPSAIFQATS